MTAVICTRNRPAMAARALDSLLAQQPPLSDILIVDNAPDHDTLRLVAETYAPAVRYVYEPVPGLNMARNRALREARGEVLAFLDDDAVADPAWAAALLAPFLADPRTAVCTGRVEPLSQSTLAQRLFEANGGFSRGLERLDLPADRRRPLHGRRAPLIAWAVSVGSGASFAVRRSAAQAAGGFDEALDLGAALPGGGDHDMFWRMLSSGRTLTYEPAALAWHEHRWEPRALAAQLAGHQRGLVAFLCKTAARERGRRRIEILAFLLWRLVKPGVRLLRRAAGRDPLPAAVLARMWLETWRGLWAYGAARRIAAARREAAGPEPA